MILRMKKSALKKSCANFTALVLLVLTGCVWVTPTRHTHTGTTSDHHDGHPGYYEVWFDNVVVDCWHAEYPNYEWYFSIDVDTSYGPGLIMETTVSLTTAGNAQYWNYLDPYGYSGWSTSELVGYFDCHDSYSIVFVAREEDGTTHRVETVW
jgi:hypothetical protein